MARRGALKDADQWLWGQLRHFPGTARAPLGASASVLKKLKAPFDRLAAFLREAATLREATGASEADLASRGAPRDLAERAARLEIDRHIPLLLSAARGGKAEPEPAAAAYFALQTFLRFGEVERAVALIPPGDPDDRSASRALLLDLRALLVELTAAALRSAGSADGEPEKAVEAFLAKRASVLGAYRKALPSAGHPFSLGSLLVLAERLRRLAAE